MIAGIRAIIFDIYGTLLNAPPGKIYPDPAVDPHLHRIIESFELKPPTSPTAALSERVDWHHQRSPHRYPEIDLRVLWREVLELPEDSPIDPLIIAAEATWHPSRWMLGAPEMLDKVHAHGLLLGLLSNAQINSLPSLFGRAALFHPRLTILSFQHGLAKPSPELFTLMAERLNELEVRPHEALMIGNDPLLDIVPAAKVGFRTALFTGQPESHRPGHCDPSFVLKHWNDLLRS